MGWRIVTISSRSKLELKMNYLVVRSTEETKRVFIDEISVLIIENTGCSLTSALLETLWKKKIAIIFCDSKRNPGAQLIPFNSRFEANEAFFRQLQWSEEIRDEVWSIIIKQKITKQAQNIRKLNEDTSKKLLSYCDGIELGDATNREGHAAKVYFNALFSSEFSRSEPCFENAALDYGYSILLSAVNRSITALGYTTKIGIFHKNTFNGFNLGCDIMEPFRPIIDSVVTQIPISYELSSEDKYCIINTLNKNIFIDNQYTTILNGIQIYTRSILSALDEQDTSLIKSFEYEF